MIPSYVLIGGKSRRFGCDKASYLVDGLSWALHVSERLSPLGEVTLVGPSPQAGPLLSHRFVADVTPPCGALSGVAAALLDRRRSFGEGLLILASCDLVDPDPAWLEPLIDAHARDSQLEVAAYRAMDRWQPFPSVVHTRWTEGLVSQFASEEHSLQATFSASRATPLPWLEPDGGPPQANTPEELARLLAKSKDQ